MAICIDAFEHPITISNHVTIWLDKYIGMMGSDEKMKEKFRQISYPLHTFDDPVKSIKFIRDNDDKKIFLICSGVLAKEIVPIVYQLPQLYMIFIFCAQTRNHREWAIDYVEKVHIFNFDEDLLISVSFPKDEYAMFLSREKTGIYLTLNMGICKS
ncbi:unnamed protein product [Didymodactylos carnosus]|uniref:Uncharacterized protein n=1 Tax=Didymodactylos carnosus TaxID=1234261 RepID=A0A815YIT0_9BILA|nr:unnamed protein product [Didymodactylos carnosus]CAF4434862.1 unnamed protein product [Didymodactylos carnosus]